MRMRAKNDKSNSLRLRLRNRILGWSMRQKMTVAFSVPVIAVSFLIYLAAGMYLQQRSAQQLQYSTEQSMAQAGSFLSSYVQNLLYISDQIRTNDTLQEILTAPDFGSHLDAKENYLEFYRLNQVVQQIELSNGDYRIGMYVPDEELYASNDFYFYPESELEEREDYPQIQAALAVGGSIYCTMMDKRTGGGAAQEYLAKLSNVTVQCADGEQRSFVIKVEIRMEQIRDVLENAAPTKGSFLILTGSDGKEICVSDPDQYEAQKDSITDYREAGNWQRVQRNRNFYAVQYDVSIPAWTITAVIPVTEFRLQLSWLLMAFAILALSTMAVVLFASFELARYYTKRIDLLNGRMEEIQRGNINLRIQEPGIPRGQDEMDELNSNFDFMIDEIQKLMKEQYRLGRSISQTEMKALQAQINPHFLYNTLDLINWGAMDYGAEDVARIARNLGQFYRLSLNHGNSAISIRDELRHVKAFVDIENAHYENVIELHVDVAEEIQTLACLNITLQPFVENSILHGMGEHAEIKSCRLDITGRREGDDVILTVQDDGPGMPDETARKLETQSSGEHGKGFGIMNVNFRIKLAYGEEYGVTYRTNDGTAAGTTDKADTSGSDAEESVEAESIEKKPSSNRRLPVRGTQVQIRIRAWNLEELEKAIQT